MAEQASQTVKLAANSSRRAMHFGVNTPDATGNWSLEVGKKTVREVSLTSSDSTHLAASRTVKDSGGSFEQRSRFTRELAIDEGTGSARAVIGYAPSNTAGPKWFIGYRERELVPGLRLTTRQVIRRDSETSQLKVVAKERSLTVLETEVRASVGLKHGLQIKTAPAGRSWLKLAK